MYSQWCKMVTYLGLRWSSGPIIYSEGEGDILGKEKQFLNIRKKGMHDRLKKNPREYWGGGGCGTKLISSSDNLLTNSLVVLSAVKKMWRSSRVRTCWNSYWLRWPLSSPDSVRWSSRRGTPSWLTHSKWPPSQSERPGNQKVKVYIIYCSSMKLYDMY